MKKIFASIALLIALVVFVSPVVAQTAKGKKITKTAKKQDPVKKDQDTTKPGGTRMGINKAGLPVKGTSKGNSAAKTTKPEEKKDEKKEETKTEPK